MLLSDVALNILRVCYPYFFPTKYFVKFYALRAVAHAFLLDVIILTVSYERADIWKLF